MKTAILLLTILASTNSFALEVFKVTQFTIFLPWATTLTFNQPKMARAVLNETNDYYQSGEMSLTLANEVAQIQSQSDMSVDEAVDFLNEAALEVLNK